MAKFAPVYMSSYDGPEYPDLEDLVLSAATFTEGDVAGTAIGTLSTLADGDDSTLSLVDSIGNPDTSGRFQLDGAGLEVGPEGGELAAGDHTVIVRETNPWTLSQTHDTELTVTVEAAG